MYSPKIYNRLISIVWSKRLRLLYFITLGYVNVYLLNLYYIRFKYSLYELTQYRINVIYSVLVMFPILNIPVYAVTIRQCNHPMSFRLAAKLYFQGRLAAYMIQTDYSNLIESESWKDTIFLITSGILARHSKGKVVHQAELLYYCSRGYSHFLCRW